MSGHPPTTGRWIGHRVTGRGRPARGAVLALSCCLALCLSGCGRDATGPATATADGSGQAPGDASCEQLVRPLNPADGGKATETALDRRFREAYNRETAGDFEQAERLYREAATLAACPCDKAHAEAGARAAAEAAALSREPDPGLPPTQFFWSRLQQLTETLPCVAIE